MQVWHCVGQPQTILNQISILIIINFEQIIMKTELKKLKGTTIKTMIGEITLKQYYRQTNTDYDVIYFKAIGVDSICKLYDLEEAASAQRFHNEMQQYSNKSLSMIYDRVHCEQIKIKKVSYGLVCFQKLDKDPSLQQCMNSLSVHEKDKLAITLIQMLQQLKQQNKIYCNIRPSNIYKCADKFVIINAEFLRVSGLRSEMDSFILQTIQNNWEYWAPEFTDTYSSQTFDYSLDVYAVGCIFYELVIGKYPFDSKLSSTNGQYDKIDTKNILYKIGQAFISKNFNRRTINLKDILAKLNQNSQTHNYPIKPNQSQSSSQISQVEMSADKNIKKSGNGIFGNISNVFSKMMNDSEGWFLNYVEDDQKSPNQKYLDNILIKMYKKQQKADKLSGIIQKFINNNSTKINSIRKVLLLIGQAIRKGPEAALHSLLANVNSIKNQFNTTLSIQSFSTLLLKKIQVNQKFKKILSGNFYLSQMANFKLLSIQDLSSLMAYLQYLIGYVSNKPNLDGSQLSQSIINFACDQIYDLVSMIILSIISIRKDNQFQLRSDNLKQLQPIQKALNLFLRKLSSLSNFISAHAIYSLEGEYIPYQEEIMLKTTPYYSTLQYFYSSSRSYKGLTVPTDYSQIFGSVKDQKKSAQSASKESKSIVVSSSEYKNYFKQEINSDDDDQFQKNSYGKIELPQTASKDSVNSYTKENTLIAPNSKLSQTKTAGYLKPNKNVCIQQDIFFKATIEQAANKNGKNQSTISFEQFGNLHKAKQKSPQKNFGDFFFFNDPKKQSLKKPPLPIKQQSKESDTKAKQSQMKKSFVQFDQIFQKNVKKQTKKDNSNLAFTQFSQVSQGKNIPNFNAFDQFLKPQSASPTRQQNPLVTKILEGLKLKQLKDLIIKNKKFVIDFSNLKLIKVIGSGSAGEVSYGKHGDQDVAIKKVKAKQNPNALKQFQRQLVTYMKIQSNPYLVSFVGVSQSSGDFYLVTQYCTNGSLFDLLHKKKLQIVLPWKQRLNFAIEIAEGMHYLHSMKPIIIHRDLKSLNVFVTKVGKDWRMKVADFGLSRSPDADMMTTQLGTIHWMAPQLLEGNQYSLKVDVYSYGILLWEILSRTTPYGNLHNPMAILKHVVIDKMRPNLQSIPTECPAQLINVMQKCWAHEPADRPTFFQILKQLKMINL